MFENAPVNPPDAIFGLNELFKADTNGSKVNLTVGVYKDEDGNVPLMKAVAEAEQKLVQAKNNKSYLPIDGMRDYCDKAGRLVLGPVANSVSWQTSQTPGGTGALRVCAELLQNSVGIDTVWMSNPTWANHPKIFGRAGYTIQKFDYLDQRGVALDFPAMMNSLGDAKSGQAILLHAACHNPTGVDLDDDQWETAARVCG